ncbi:MAG: FAD-dependent oxidoreductase [Nitrospinae bacterium]|nr:FAD-dependent oxidoreductase [Nitrospinota bacterium]
MLKNDFSVNEEYLQNPLALFNNEVPEEKLYFAGQITGVEGYLESAASGLLVGLNVIRHLNNEEPLQFPQTTALGALNYHITKQEKKYQPSNINYSLFAPLETRIKKKKEKQTAYMERSLRTLSDYITKI